MSDWSKQEPPRGDDDSTGDLSGQDLEPDADADWERRLRIYTTRCLHFNDAVARENIARMIRPIVRILVRSFPRDYHDEATKLLTAKAIQVLNRGYDRVDNLGAYLRTGLTNERNSLYTKLKRDRRFMRSLDALSDFERDRLDSRRPSQQGGDLLQSDPAVDEFITNEHILQKIQKYIDEADRQDRYLEVKMGEAIRRSYLMGENFTEACRGLGYPEKEVSGLQQKLYRDKKNRRSRLWKLWLEVFSDG